jgi:hypothetical protein
MPTTPRSPQLSVYQPQPNQKVTLNVPFTVSGQVSDQKGVEPHTIDSVTVQVDGGPLTRATLKVIQNPQIVLVSFTATVQVTGGADPHTVTVTATDDAGLKDTKTVQVFAGQVFAADAPAVVVDLISPLPIDPTDPKVVTMIQQFQQSLEPLSSSLGSIGKILAGPNLLVAKTPGGVPVLRMGLWIEDSTFPVVHVSGYPLPLVPDPGVTQGFANVPLLPVPDPSGLSPSFAVSVTTVAMQKLLDAAAPGLKSAASGQGVSLDSITVKMNQPSSVTTHFSGSLPLGIGFSLDVTETLGVVPLANADPPQSVPAVTGSSHSSSVGSVLDWFLGVFIPVFGLALSAAWGLVSSQAGDAQGQIDGEVGPLVAAIPPRIPFRNSALPGVPFGLPDFPAMVLNWISFGVTATGILGTGTTQIVARNQSLVSMTVSGSSEITGFQADLGGGATQTYQLALVNLAPDPGKLSWQVSGTAAKSGGISIAPFAQSGSFPAHFPLPIKVAPGTYPFTLAVSGTETCGTDASKTLTGTSSMAVKVVAKKNPKNPF